MRVYVAGKFEEKDRVRRVQAALVEAGHSVAYDWTQHDWLDLDGDALASYLALCASVDLVGVRAADALVLLYDAGSRGAFVEFGAAIALGKLVVVVGAPGGRGTLPFFCIGEVRHAPDDAGVVAALAAGAAP